MSQPAQPPGLSMIDRRRIEAELLHHVHDVLCERHGAEEAAAIIGAAVRKSAIEQGARFAAAAGETSLATYAAILPLWTKDGALQLEVREQTATDLRFEVTRCRYAEMYREMGLGDIGHLLSCARDGAFCEGYDKKLHLTRTRTIMEGAASCDFHYRYGEE